MTVVVLICEYVLCVIDKKCALRLADQDILKEYDAIRKVHMHLDDDHDGSVDTRESAEVTFVSVCMCVCPLVLINKLLPSI